jgi:phospho-N-acetylmuramoyl-pentapeptide-transferase
MRGLLSNHLYIPFLNVNVEINWILYLVFAAFVIVGCVNAVNLTDESTRLACSVTFVVMVFFTVTGCLWSAGGSQALFPAAMAGGLAAFFVYNHHPPPRSLWATPAASFWAAPWRPWPFPWICP